MNHFIKQYLKFKIFVFLHELSVKIHPFWLFGGF